MGVDISASDVYWHAKKIIDWAKDNKYSKTEAIAMIEKCLDEDYKEIKVKDYNYNTMFKILKPYSSITTYCYNIASVKTEIAENLQKFAYLDRQIVGIKIFYPRKLNESDKFHLTHR